MICAIHYGKKWEYNDRYLSVYVSVEFSCIDDGTWGQSMSNNTVFVELCLSAFGTDLYCRQHEQTDNQLGVDVSLWITMMIISGSGPLILVGGGKHLVCNLKNNYNPFLHAKKAHPLKRVKKLTPHAHRTHIFYTQIQLFFMKTAILLSLVISRLASSPMEGTLL